MKTREVILSCLSSANKKYQQSSKKIETALNYYIDLNRFSNQVKQIQFTYLIPTESIQELREYQFLTQYNNNFVIDMSLIVDIPEEDKDNEEIILQNMAELFLESILLYPKLIKQFKIEQFYQEVRDVFARMAWTTRELFLVA